MRSSIIVAGVLAISTTAWIVSGQIGAEKHQAHVNNLKGAAKKSDKLISVRVKASVPRTRELAVIVNGQTEESRRVIIRAETAGSISEVTGEEGKVIEAGDVIAQQNIGDRSARLTQAVALVRQREIEFRAAKQLAKKGFRSQAKLAEAQSMLDAARAQTKSTRLDLSKTTIKAPFKGVLETHYVEKGNFVKIGDNIAEFIDLDPILAVGFVSERNIGEIKIGGPGKVTLVNGQNAYGKVRYIAAVADRETRSFRVELEIPNAEHKIRSGLTVELTLPVNPTQAYVISPANLTLSDAGTIGVRTVDDGNIVRFTPIEILSDSKEGLWVTGLKGGQRLITVGHEYVKAGQKVVPVPETPKTGT
ncbi:MAG: efflux RND transporter periplasmic adaptor subunit [Pseudomonadota bacterium]|nr:efflux RND transporter periplasmic adaptor subunit [Pseudomonadota bacterium]